MSHQHHLPSRPRTMPQTRREFLHNGLVQTSQPLESCPICKEPHTEPVQPAACGHIFCKSCILGWCDRLAQGTCPCCRVQLWTEIDPVPLRVLGEEETFRLLNQIEAFTSDAEGTIAVVREFLGLGEVVVADTDIIWALAEGVGALPQHIPIDDHQEVMLFDTSCAVGVQAMAVLLPIWYADQTESDLSFEQRLEWLQIVILMSEILQSDWQGLIGTHFDLGHRLEAMVNDSAREEGMDPTSMFQELWVSDWFRHEDDYGDGPQSTLQQTTQRQMLERLIEHIFRCASPIGALRAEQLQEGWRWAWA